MIVLERNVEKMSDLWAHAADVMAGVSLSPKVPSGGVDHQRAGQSRTAVGSVEVVDESLARLNGKRDLEHAGPASNPHHVSHVSRLNKDENIKGQVPTVLPSFGKKK